MSPVEPLTAVMIGAGDRGKDVYGRYALDHPSALQFLAIAEPQAARRETFARQHGIPSERCFEQWETLLTQPQLAKAAFVCTPDRFHEQPALAALKGGYHVLLEKPMATSAAACRQLVATARQQKRHLQICHVMRYSRFFQTVQQAIQSGLLGEIICLSQRENVSYWHMAHSFVRGNWRNRATSNPMILAKCCHDLDLLQWLVGARSDKISSFGTLTHYRPERAPAGAPPRCTDGCPVEAECHFSAIDIYVRLRPLLHLVQLSDRRPLAALARLMERYPTQMAQLARFIPPLRQFVNYSGWPVRVMSDDFTPEGRYRALEDPQNPYGRCVYHCDNDVVDHQHVDIEFENGVTATLIMHGHSYAEGRDLRIDGSAGTLIGQLYMHGQRLVLHDKRTGKSKLLLEQPFTLDEDGHGGGDEGLMRSFISLLQDSGQPSMTTDAAGALESHLMAFAADRSRLEGRVVRMEELR
ncbi:MAG: Gfo/Idh/MocA family oxidoreductase [Candidatus Promineifilaceae bacterium]|nr:Gfo/Idh/MocA family oxidoreductase [Candidatus Promineifilaceae bacterium]